MIKFGRNALFLGKIPIESQKMIKRTQNTVILGKINTAILIVSVLSLFFNIAGNQWLLINI